MVYEFRQDDPRKCTSARLRRLQIVKSLPSLGRIPSGSVVLNPTATRTLTQADRPLVLREGIVGLDCSWNRSQDVFDRQILGENRRLPTLLAGNPSSYGLMGRLSTAEALAAALMITGFEMQARKVLSPFRWGETFLSLNKEPLREYAGSMPEMITSIEMEFFGPTRRG